MKSSGPASPGKPRVLTPAILPCAVSSLLSPPQAPLLCLTPLHVFWTELRKERRKDGMEGRMNKVREGRKKIESHFLKA